MEKDCRTFRERHRQKDFKTEGWFAYPLGTKKRRAQAEDLLDQLVVQGVCPGKYGNQPPTTIDQKYIDASEKEARHVGKKLFRFSPGR
jgi:hypothetical protein